MKCLRGLCEYWSPAGGTVWDNGNFKMWTLNGGSKSLGVERRGGREREEEGRDFQFFVVVIVVV